MEAGTWHSIAVRTTCIKRCVRDILDGIDELNGFALVWGIELHIACGVDTESRPCCTKSMTASRWGYEIHSNCI